MKGSIFNLYGIGRLKFSASVSSMIALVIFISLNRYVPNGYLLNIVVFAVVLIASLLSVRGVEKYLIKDPKEVVVDEFLGMYILLIIANSLSFYTNITLYVIFRVLDLTKLWPIYYLDRTGSKYGFLIDDIGIGVVVGLIYLLVQTITYIS